MDVELVGSYDRRVADEDDAARWVVHGERSVYRSDWVTVGLADISVPSGERFEHHTVEFPPAAMAVVFDDAREHVLLSWRHRFAPEVWNWELPGGIVEQGEDPAVTVAREVEEETGYRPRSTRHLVTFEPAVGMLRNPHYVYAVDGVERVGNPTELDEGRFRWVPYAEVPELVRAGQVLNSGALVALLYVLALDGGS
ncbi:NUDIX hydrolase [Saccharomonospora piscinae]|nr:NUDIX hydrolase [Saccharomonospora piscinae]TLW92463.1 NUDIX hydrolase [Saccharomonospora piscinae]